MNLDSSWALIISIVSLLYAMLTNRKDVFIQDSHEVMQDNSKSYFTGKYYYFGKNLDSYVLLFKALIKFGVITVGYAGVSSLFVYLGDSGFIVLFCILYVICVIRLLKMTIEQIRLVNPRFKRTFMEACSAIGLTCNSFVFYLCCMVYVSDSGLLLAGSILLMFMCVACYIIPIGYYYSKINELVQYKIKLHGDVRELFSFQFKTVDGKIWELNKDFDFLVIQDSGDYNLVLPSKECYLIEKSSIEDFGYFVKERNREIEY